MQKLKDSNKKTCTTRNVKGSPSDTQKMTPDIWEYVPQMKNSGNSNKRCVCLFTIRIL